MTVNQQIGTRLRQARELRGFSAQALADQLAEKEITRDVTANIIYRWEAGQTPIPADALVAVLQILQCSPYYIFGDFSPVDPEDKRLHNAIQILPRKEKQILNYLLTEWLGCFHRLVELALMYAAMPERVRRRAVRHCMKLFNDHRSELTPASAQVDYQKVYTGFLHLGRGASSSERDNTTNIM